MGDHSKCFSTSAGGAHEAGVQQNLEKEKISAAAKLHNIIPRDIHCML